MPALLGTCIFRCVPMKTMMTMNHLFTKSQHLQVQKIATSLPLSDPAFVIITVKMPAIN